MKIILVRHGESEHNAKTNLSRDSKLTKKGEIQAKHLGMKLKKEKIKIDAIYTSNLIRSKRTAEIISKIIKVPIKKSFDEFNEYHIYHILSKMVRLVSPRLRKLEKLLKEISKNKTKDKTIMIVAHGRTNRIIIAYLLQIPLGKYLVRLAQHNTGLSVLYWSKTFKNWRMESMNDFTHLPRRLATH
ncbi:histidine phosphatase family protein [Candidatus Pacearchaeota archaeon]|nr:histidine phosphatase family protein [Candidatus Pacearchaeota archaeon]